MVVFIAVQIRNQMVPGHGQRKRAEQSEVTQKPELPSQRTQNAATIQEHRNYSTNDR
jgi:hypothetical protein